MLKKLSKRRPVLKRLKESYGYLRTSYGVQTREFFKNSTLHGVKYIAENDRPFIERFMWFTCVTMGTVATCVVILSLWDKFQTNPTITGLDTDFHNWLVPFPAITLCPDKPASVQSITTYLGISDNETDPQDNELIQFYQDLSQLSLNNIPKFVDKYHDGVPKQILSGDLRQLMLNITDQCEDIFKDCRFKDDIIRCCNAGSASFYPVLTESGFCFSFNSRHFGIDNTADNFNMQYIKETDIKWSLDFALISRKVLTPLYIINSDDMINIDLQPQLIWDSKVDKIMFSFKQTYTTEDTRQLSVKQRRCIFEDEVQLAVDNIYTYTACTIQCRMENIRSRCDCVPFFYPKISGFQYCNLSRLQCVAKHLQEIKDVGRCECQLGCQNTIYEVETQKVKPETATTNKIQMGFVSWPMVRYKREVLFGWVDLLVSFGGIAGLFLGFSLLSAVEIIYYFTLRAFIAAFRERKYLNKVRKENSNKPQPAHDLSMTPYFIAPPLPGRGIDIVVGQFEKMDFQYGGNFKKNNKMLVVEMIPPFGIEFVN